MAFNPSIDVNAWKTIQWSPDVPKLDTQLTELMLKLSTWCTSANQALTTAGMGTVAWANVTGKRIANFYGADTTNTNSYAVTVNSDFQLTAGVTVFFTITNVNTAAPTLNVNGGGAVALVNRANIALAANELGPQMHGATYDGTSWRVFTRLCRCYAATNPLTVNVDCLGYDEVRIQISVTASGATTCNIQHLSDGVAVFINIGNSVGTTQNYAFVPSDPANVTYPAFFIPNTAVAGAVALRIDTAQGLSTGNNAMYQGRFRAGVGLYCK